MDLVFKVLRRDKVFENVKTVQFCVSYKIQKKKHNVIDEIYNETTSFSSFINVLKTSLCIRKKKMFLFVSVII